MTYHGMRNALKHPFSRLYGSSPYYAACREGRSSHNGWIWLPLVVKLVETLQAATQSIYSLKNYK